MSMKLSSKIVVIVCTIMLSATILGAVAAFKFMPTSIQVYFAGIAGCDLSDEVLGKDDPKFEGVKFWEPPLAQIYRWKQLVVSEDFVVNDSLSTNESVYHILLTASDNTKYTCDNEIITFVKHYFELGAPVDHMNDRGFTPIHEAIITGNVNFVSLLKDLDSNLNLKVIKAGSPVDDFNSRELAQYFLEKNPGDKRWEEISETIKTKSNNGN